MTESLQDDPGLRAWLSQRAALWQQIEARIGELARGKRHSIEDANEAVQGYRALAHDLSMARRVLPGSRITRYLEANYRRAHILLTRPAHRFFSDLLTLLRDEIPAITRELQGQIYAVTALFVLAAVAGAWLVATHPELVSLFLSEETINQVEAGKLWTDDALNVVPAALMSIEILTNNIVVACFAAVFGVLFGLGTFYFMAMNGLMIGALFAFTAHHGLGWRLFEFTAAHGPVELTTICLAGAVGVSLGEALVRPQLATRLASFQAAVLRGAKYVAMCVVLLMVCGIIEGHVSPDPSFPVWSRLVIGWSWWLIAMCLVTGRLWRPRTTAAKAAHR